MSVVTVCKNVIGSNNKRGWVSPQPPIRIAKTRAGKAMDHAFDVAITDKAGNVVATIESTVDGNPIVKCGAKVAIKTLYPVRKIL